MCVHTQHCTGWQASGWPAARRAALRVPSVCCCPARLLAPLVALSGVWHQGPQRWQDGLVGSWVVGRDCICTDATTSSGWLGTSCLFRGLTGREKPLYLSAFGPRGVLAEGLNAPEPFPCNQSYRGAQPLLFVSRGKHVPHLENKFIS